jgi:uncharacterized protein (DUF1684 family)
VTTERATPADWEQGDGSPSDRVWLADWRREVGALYVEVRRRSVEDPVAAHRYWRESRARLFRQHPQSPVPRADRDGFVAQHFAYDPALRFEVVLQPAPPSLPGALALELPNSGADTLAFSRLGKVVIPFADRSRSLSVFWMTGYAGGLFLPFRDATNGIETYGAGRYLVDAAKSADLGGDPASGSLILDFNFAFQPSCAFDPQWACPLAPPENRLDIPIRAGERLTAEGAS